MKEKIIGLAIIIMLTSLSYTLATEGNSHGEHDKIAVKVGNVICPVSGENVETMGGGIEHIYNGKIYNLCCTGCVEIFEKEPEKYSEIVEDGEEKAHKESHHAH